MSFFSKIWAALKKFFTNPSVDQTIETSLAIVQPLIAAVLTFTMGAPAAAAANSVIAKIQTALAAVGQVAADIKSGVTTSATGAQQVVSVLKTIQSDLATILSASQIKDPATSAKITAIVDSVDESISELITNLTGATAASNASTPPAPTPTV